MKKFPFVIVCLAAISLPLTALADDPSGRRSKSRKTPVEEQSAVDNDNGGSSYSDNLSFTDTQKDLNMMAYQAREKEDFKRAESLYETILSINEFNLTWYQLAMVYSRQNKCMEAYDAYDHATKAKDLPDDGGAITRVKEQMRTAMPSEIQALNDKCTAKIRFNCEPADILISVDGGKEFECSDKVLPFVPGRHAIYATTSFGFSNVTIDAKPNSDGQLVKLTVINYEELATTAGMTIESLERKSKLYKTLGWTFFGLGIVGSGVSAGLLGYYWSDYIHAYNASKNANDSKLTEKRDKAHSNLIGTYAGIGVGGALAVTGAVLLIVDAVSVEPRLELMRRDLGALEISPMFSPEFSGLTISGTF